MEGLLDYRKKPRKLPMKKRENKASRMCTFTKRRYGLFNKARELQLLTGAQISVVVFSEAGRPYFHGSTEAMNRFLAQQQPQPQQQEEPITVPEERVPEIETQEEEEEPIRGGFEEFVRGIKRALADDPKSVIFESLMRQIEEMGDTQTQENS